MNYIIDPRFFYLVDILSRISAIATFAFAIGIIGLIISIVLYFMAVSERESYGENDSDYKQFLSFHKVLLKPMLICCIVSFPLMIFIPSTDTFYKMLLAQYATVDNVEAAFTAIQEGAKAIMEALK